MSEIREDYSQYVKQTAKLMGLKLTSEYLPGVIKNFHSLAEISTLITDFELTDNIEIAPTFEPKNSQ